MEGLLRKVLGIKHKNGHKLIAVCKTNGHGTLDIDIQGESSEREKKEKRKIIHQDTLWTKHPTKSFGFLIIFLVWRWNSPLLCFERCRSGKRTGIIVHRCRGNKSRLEKQRNGMAAVPGDFAVWSIPDLKGWLASRVTLVLTTGVPDSSRLLRTLFRASAI